MPKRQLTQRILLTCLGALLCYFIATPASLFVSMPASPVAAPVPPAGNAPTAIRFIGEDSCGGGQAAWSFKINGSNMPGTFAAASSCTCGEEPRTIANVTDPAALALLGSETCNTFTATNSVNLYQIYMRAEIVRPTGVESVCIFDRNNQNCVDRTWNCAGYTYTAGVAGTSTLPDGDGDGIPSCTDPDSDNDGVLNASDNCPFKVNVNQIDTDGNGAGDACDAFDRDSDGLWNINDNCPDNANADQADTDGDGVGNVCSPNLAAVPWGGNRAKSHATRSGASFLLHASASLNGAPVSLTSGTWDPGDGAGPINIGVGNSRVLELEHVYTGAVGTPYTATIRVVAATGKVYTDTQKIVIQVDALDTKVNMAIDRALWANHKSLTLSGSGATTMANCTDNDATACTSGAMQAFEVNGHRESGNSATDPYVDDVARGLRWLQNNLRKLTITAQAGGNPDTNGNGFGLEYPGNEPVYVLGQIVDAFIASGTKDKVATMGVTGVVGRTYKDIVTDLMDSYSFGMNENNQGGWIYNWNDQGGIDSSSSGWWGVGGHAAEVWGITQPQWVKDLNKNFGIPRLQNANGACGYRDSNPNSTADTAACGIMMSLDGLSRSSARFTSMENNLRSTFPGQSTNSIYDMYNVAKAMRLAKDDSGNPAPIVMMGGTKDWYGDPGDGFAQRLVSSQAANGQLAPYGGWGSGALANSWGILILSPALFEQGPTAVCAVDATTVCQAGASGGCNTTGTNPYATVNFDGSQSLAGDNQIATYSWNFQNGGSTVDATTVGASTQYSTVGTYNVQLTVADTKGNSSAVTCPVSVTSSALPPIADAGGPYTMRIGTGSLTLDASGSTGRGSNLVSYEWDFKGAVNFATIDSTSITTNQTAYFNGLGLGTYDIGLRIKDDNQPINTITNFSTVTVADCAPPVITVPNNISVVTPNASAPVSFAVSGTDNVDASVTVICSSAPTTGLTSGSNFPVGTTTITCKAADRAGNQAAPQSFTITVSNNRAPVAQNDTATTFSGTPVTVSVLTNDSDADGDTIAVTGTSAGPANGSVTVNANGTITYAPNLGFAGTDSFTYAISDGKGGTASASVTVTVSKRIATVTANGGTKVYGATDPALTATSTGFLAADGITVSETRVAGETVGDYKTTATAAGATLSNYSVTYVDGNFSITKKSATVTANGGTKVYGATDPALTATSTGFLAADGITVSETRVAGETVGDYKTTATAAGATLSNYSVTYVDGNFSITKKSATVTAGSGTKVFGTPDTALSATTQAGFLAADVAGIALASTRAAGETAGNYATTATATGGNVANYDVTYVAGNFSITQASTTTSVASSLNPSAVGTAVTFTAKVVAVAPTVGIPTGTVTFRDGTTVLGTSTLNAAGEATLTTSSLIVALHPITASYNGDVNFKVSSSAVLNQIVFAYPAGPGGGDFVIGDLNAVMGKSVTFWGAQWEKLNQLSGGTVNASFKGFANSVTTAPPRAGATWTTDPGNSSGSPASVQAYIAVIVSSKITKSGSTISGNIPRIVIVKTNAGYDNNPGHAGTGTVVAILP